MWTPRGSQAVAGPGMWASAVWPVAGVHGREPVIHRLSCTLSAKGAACLPSPEMDSPPAPTSAWRRLLARARPSELAGLAVLAVGAAVLLAVLWLQGRAPAPVAALQVRQAVATTAPAELVVHVAGAVRAPGVYRLPGGSRVADAVQAAGGTVPGAALDRVNLARPMVDGEQLLVPHAAADPAAGSGAPAGGGESAVVGGDPGLTDGPPALRPDGRLDLNRATVSDLDVLPGIGPVLAERIVAAREERGSFTSVAELREIPGIGERRFAELAELVAVGP